MARVAFTITDGADGQTVDCEARCDDMTNPEAPALLISQYIADNWVGLVAAARLAHRQAILQEARSLQQEGELRRPPALVDERGIELPPLNALPLDKLQ
jgi:hypothetical protein